MWTRAVLAPHPKINLFLFVRRDVCFGTKGVRRGVWLVASRDSVCYITAEERQLGYIVSSSISLHYILWGGDWKK